MGDIVIEYYQDIDPENPSAYFRFIEAVRTIKSTDWATIVLDSVSEAVKNARWWEQFAVNSQANDPRQHWAGCVDRIERLVTGSFKSYPCHTVVTAHTAAKVVYTTMGRGGSAQRQMRSGAGDAADEATGRVIWQLDLPGRLGGSLPRAFGEVYHMYVDNDTPCLQTQASDEYFAKSHIRAPSPCKPSFAALTAKFETAPTLHTLVYGVSGSGKTTFAATFPKPMLVLTFDGMGNDMPYLDQGKAGELQYHQDSKDEQHWTPWRRIVCD